MPQVSLVSVSYPQHGSPACGCGPEVHGQAEHMGTKHVVVEAENAVVAVPGRGLEPLVGGLEDLAEQHGRVLELLWSRGLDVEVVAVAGA